MYTDIIKYAALQQLDPTKSNDFNKIYTFIKNRYPGNDINDFVCSFPLFDSFAIKSKGVNYDFNFRDLAVILISYISRSLKISFLTSEDECGKKHHTSAISVVNGFFKSKLGNSSYGAINGYNNFLNKTIDVLNTRSKVHLFNCLMSVSNKYEIKNFDRERDFSYDFFLNFATKRIMKDVNEYIFFTNNCIGHLDYNFNYEQDSLKTIAFNHLFSSIDESFSNIEIYQDKELFVGFLNQTNFFVHKVYSANTYPSKEEYCSEWEWSISNLYNKISNIVEDERFGLKDLPIIKATADMLRDMYSNRKNRSIEQSLLRIAEKLHKEPIKLDIYELKKINSYIYTDAINVSNVSRSKIAEGIKNEYNDEYIFEAKRFISSELERLNFPESTNHTVILCYLNVLLDRQLILIKEKNEKD